MDITAARTLALDLLAAHDLGNDWWIKFRSSRFTAGCCSYDTNTLTFSNQLVTLWDEAKVTNLILHEIAHAIAGPNVQAHGTEWKQIARRIGCDGERCYGAHESTEDLDRVEAKLADARRPVVTVVPEKPVVVCACHNLELTRAGECAFN